MKSWERITPHSISLILENSANEFHEEGLTGAVTPDDTYQALKLQGYCFMKSGMNAFPFFT